MTINTLKIKLMRNVNLFLYLGIILTSISLLMSYYFLFDNSMEKSVSLFILIIIFTIIASQALYKYFSEKKKISKIISMIQKRPKTLKSYYLRKTKRSTKTVNLYIITIHFTGFIRRKILLKEHNIDSCLKLLKNINPKIKTF